MKKTLFLICAITVSSLSVALAQSKPENNNKDAEKIKKAVRDDSLGEKVDDSTIQYKVIENKKEYYLKQKQLEQNKNNPINNEKPIPNKEIKGIKKEKDECE